MFPWRSERRRMNPIGWRMDSSAFVVDFPHCCLHDDSLAVRNAQMVDGKDTENVDK
jgi:hypothetical protein